MKRKTTIEIGYKFKIYPTEKQKAFFEKHFGCVRFIYNHLLNLRIEAYKKDKTNISGYEAKKYIAKLKKQEEYKWLSEVNSQSLQEAAIDLDKAYRRFFGKLSAYPNFKKKQSQQKFKIPQNFYLRETKKGKFYLEVPKLKSDIKVNVHRKIEGPINHITISKTPTGKYFASFNCRVAKNRVFKKKDSKTDKIGIDLGIRSFIVTDKGEKIKAPAFLRLLERRLKTSQKALSRKKKYSANYCKQRKKIATVHEKISNQRSNFLHKLSFKITDENQIIYLEDLNVKGMIKNRHLSKSISDASWGEFTRQLKYKSKWRDKELIQIGRFEASSKICNVCGYKNEDLKLHQRKWLCPRCRTLHDRDGQDMSKVKPVEKSTAVFSLKRRQVGSVKQEPVPSIGMHGNLLP
jgi:putative transposase